MKTVLVLVLGILLLPAVSLAEKQTVVSSVTSYADPAGRISKKAITISWTADDGDPDAGVSSITINPATYQIKGWYWYEAITNPGSTAPTDNYDIVVTDTDGVDVSGGLLADRDSTNSERVLLGRQANGYPIIRSSWMWSLSNNSAADATGTCTLVFVEE